MARNKTQSKPRSPSQASASPRAPGSTRSAHPTVSGRWLLTALAITIPGAVVCIWALFCFLFWQGSWQLLYHPTAAVRRTPASAGLAYDAVGFATADTGTPQLQGWWISGGPAAKYTVLFSHDRSGNLSDTVDELARLHAMDVNVLAFDYRGYGQSLFVHPSEARWRQDAEWALSYLTGTRHIDPRTIVLDGRGLGGDLALEVAAAHPELAGVVLEWPLDTAAHLIFDDARARLVPAHLLVQDRWNLARPAAALRVPSLWFEQNGADDTAFDRVTARKTRVWLSAGATAQKDFEQTFSSWMDDLQKR